MLTGISALYIKSCLIIRKPFPRRLISHVSFSPWHNDGCDWEYLIPARLIRICPDWCKFSGRRNTLCSDHDGIHSSVEASLVANQFQLWSDKLTGIDSIFFRLKCILFIWMELKNKLLQLIIRPDICHFFSTNVLLGSTFLHMKFRDKTA